MLSSNSEEWSTFAFCPETAQTQIQTQQSWEPLIYAYVTLIQHDVNSHHKRNISVNKRSPAMLALRIIRPKMKIHKSDWQILVT